MQLAARSDSETVPVLDATPPLPACFRCGSPGEVPIRPHGLAMCQACYCAELAVSVDTGEPAPL